MTKQMAFYFDSSACTGCKACQIACKDRSNLPVGVNWRRVIQYEGGGWVPDPTNKDVLMPNNIFVYAITASCMHCADPLCMECCPTGGISKRADGIVVIDEDQCIGCRYCSWACPYGATHFNDEAGVMTKCDFCADFLALGENPVCVDACVMRALDYGELDELQARYGDVAAVAPLPSPDITNPSLVITPHKHAQPSSNGTGHISSLEEV